MVCVKLFPVDGRLVFCIRIRMCLLHNSRCPHGVCQAVHCCWQACPLLSSSHLCLLLSDSSCRPRLSIRPVLTYLQCDFHLPNGRWEFNSMVSFWKCTVCCAQSGLDARVDCCVSPSHHLLPNGDGVWGVHPSCTAQPPNDVACGSSR